MSERRSTCFLLLHPSLPDRRQFDDASVALRNLLKLTPDDTKAKSLLSEFEKLSKVTKPLGNFDRIKTALEKSGFTYGTTLNGVEIYGKTVGKGPTSINIRNCGGDCCEGFLTAFPKSNDDWRSTLAVLYGTLEDTLSQNKTDAATVKERVPVLVDQIMSNLKHANRTEFTFDGLHVRGLCDPETDEEHAAGTGPMLFVKLWVP